MRHVFLQDLCRGSEGRWIASTSIMMTVMEMVRRVTPPMKEAAPMSANAPGSIHDHVLGGRNTPFGALQHNKGSRENDVQLC